ncbi:unnamed protein product [Candidula unifasciata]|uniref:Uncharacterized protein n=1 Tax=Candidula unifasciata TaxID=100452 RepID=A0A8S3Z2A8_9EUPU|nr:unnamed protein product [Candidula unifasciata]
MSALPPSYDAHQNYPNDPSKTAYQIPPPQPAYAQPQPGYAQPQPGYAQPQPAYAQPQQAYTQPQSTGYSNAGYGQAPGTHATQPGYSTQFIDTEYASQPKSDDEGLFGASFSNKAIRRAFIRKVYMILFTQLLVTFSFICLFIFVDSVKRWVQENMWFYLLAYGLFLVFYITLACCPSVRRQYPGNLICLAVFTLAFSYMAATISSFHDTGIVLLAAGITAAVCLSISLFAIQTKIDFTMCSGLLFVLVMVLFFFGWACLITFYAWGGSSRIMSCVYGGLAALVFGLFLIYDTQQVVGGRKYEISPEEYIYGALQLYIDVVYIFIIILGFMGKK